MNSPCLIWNSATRHFALVSHELGTAMLHVGNTEGFNRLSCHPNAKRVVIRQAGGACCVDVEANNLTLSSGLKMGRIQAKELASQLHEAFGWPVFNVKASGKLVAVI